MEVTDFLTILGLGLAVWALIQKKERKFVLLFFSKPQINAFIIGIIYLHYLFAFDWLRDNWFPSLNYFSFDKGIPNEIWAYIFSIILFGIPILIVLFGFFSSSRRNELIDLYNSLLKENEIDLLVEYINKYHTENIKDYLIGLSHLPEKETIDLILRRRTEKDEEYENLIKPKRIKFAASVYGFIIQNENFVNKAAPIYPELFAKIFSGMETEKASNENLVKKFIESIFETKNQEFISELKIANNSNSSLDGINDNYDIPILHSILSHTKTAAKNSVWYPIGEKGIKSIKYDKEQKEFILKKYDEDLESEQWNHKIHIAIVYFNYMVRETIYKDSESHMWLYYYRNFTDLLIETIPKKNNYDGTLGNPSFAHKLINDQTENMRGWLELSREQKVTFRVIDTIKCLGYCLNAICETKNKKISEKFKINQLDLIISLWFTHSTSEEYEDSSLTTEWLTTMFLNPRWVNQGGNERTDNYIELLEKSWAEFDKIPYRMHGQNDIIEKFKLDVLEPIGLGE